LRGEQFADAQFLLRRLETDEILYVSYSGAPVLDDQGDPLLIVVTMRDITAIKQTEMRLAETLEELNKEYEKEHRIAEALQRSLVNKPTRHGDGIEVETVYKPALEEAAVGGDYFDVFPLEGGKLAFVVGDVSGKGLEAASRTAEIKFTLRAYLREYGRAAASLTRLNIFLCESKVLEDQPSEDMQEYFVALTLAVTDTATGDVEIAVGGAEPPMIVRADGAVEEAKAHGMPLGISTKAEYEPFQAVLEPGDLLMIATDGLTEARQGRAFLGNEGLANLALEARHEKSLERLGQRIFEGADRFARGRLHDDVCLLLARRE
jgi:serine phosphatase RsbU (regulator of sigma subunit)